jgi:hypothetical protein
MNYSSANKMNLLALKDYVDAFPLPFVILSPVFKHDEIVDFTFEYANHAAAVSNNLSADEFTGKNILDVYPGHKDNDVFTGLKEVYQTGNPWSKSVKYPGPLGSSTIPRYYTFHADKKNDFILAGWAEFTDIKLAEENFRKSEEELKVSLKEKEMLIHEKELLIREAHHRIKNNLQLISSLIRLHTSERNDIDSELFKTIENKVYSISLLHEHLYQRTSLSTVNLGSYISDLIKYLLSSGNHDKIELKTDISEIEIETDRAVSLGLIVNELVTNSFQGERKWHNQC